MMTNPPVGGVSVPLALVRPSLGSVAWSVVDRTHAYSEEPQAGELIQDCQSMYIPIIGLPGSPHCAAGMLNLDRADSL